MRHTIEIKPAIKPALRHKIERILIEDGYILIGGGTMVDGSSSDISFESPSSNGSEIEENEDGG